MMNREQLINAMIEMNEKVVSESRSFSSTEREQYEQMESQLEELEREQRIKTKREMRSQWGCQSDNQIRKDDDLKMNNQEFRSFLNDTNQRNYIEERAVTLKADNGAVVQESVTDMVIKKMQELSALFGDSQIFNSVNGDLKVPKNNADDLSATFVGENVALDVQKLAFTSVKLQAKRVGCAICITEDLLLSAGVNMTNFVVNMLAEKLALAVENSILNGSKAEEFEGILAHTQMKKIEVPAITADSVIELVRTMNPMLSQDAYLICNKATFIQLSKLTSGAGEYLIAGRGDFDKKIPAFTVQGFPIRVSQCMPDNQVLFIVPKHALATLVKGGLQLKRVNSDSDNALRSTELFVATMYADTKLVNEEACVLLKVQE